MSVTEIKEQLYTAIESIKDEKFLEALLTIVSQKQSQDYPLTEEQIQILEERHEWYLKGEEKTITLEEIRILEEREARYQSGASKTTPWKEVQQEIKRKYGF